MTEYVCDYNHYDADEQIITKPAEWWTEGGSGEWVPLCNACLPEFWAGDERPMTIIPISMVPEGPKYLKKMEDR